ncbi:MAG: TonB-dependent receptor [Candidatus Electrothrix sp. AW1]|nr:TonB-dependent receptor [Candidatus Electrothrix sp. AX1]MCI5181433.1 TonB-dependent receptor [Candidatus Electrothrix gigas]
MKKCYSVLTVQLLTSICGSICGSICTAQTAEHAVSMDEVIVTAARTSESKKEVSVNVTVIDQEEIRQSASRNIGDLLAEKSIGHIHKYPAGLTSIGIRGFRTDSHGNDLQGHVLILLDGRRAGTGNVAKLLTKNVERIEVVRGAGAVQYGSAGMGGVVNIITRKAERTAAFVEAGGGSFGANKMNVGGTLKKGKFDFSGSYTRTSQDDYETGNGDEFGNTGYDAASGVSVNLGWSFTGKNRLGLIFTRSELDSYGSPGYFSANDLDDTTDKENYSVDLNYTGATSTDHWQWMVRWFFGKDENSWLDPTGSDPTGWDNGIASSNATDQQGAQAQLTGNFGHTRLTGGIDWLDYEVENTWTPQKTTYTNPAVFLLGKTTFPDQGLTLDIGLRYDSYEVEVVEPAGRDTDDSHFTPKLGLSWMVTEQLKLRTQYAQAFMIPSADQLAANFDSYGSKVVGNPDLDPETSSTYEAGMDYNRNSFRAGFTYFHTDFEDKIVTDYLADGSKTWKNLGDATISGVEAEFSYDLGMTMDWEWEVRPYFNMTLLTEFEDENTDEKLHYVSGATLSAGLVVSNGDGIACRLNIAYAGAQDVEDWESDAYPTPVVELDASTVTNLTASWRFYEDDHLGAFTLRGEINNLFDEEYAYVKGYPLPGQSFFASLRWNY